MLLKSEGRPRPRVQVVGSILLLVTISAMLGGCAWLQDLINPNQAPVAVISANSTSGEAPLEVTFDASESYDPDGDEIGYEWDFGDGKTDQGQTAYHTFGVAGTYIVQLTIADNKGTTATASIRVSSVHVSEHSTGLDGVASFSCSGGQLHIKAIDSETSPISGLTCSVTTDNDDSIVFLADPSGRYIPRLLSFIETPEVANPSGHAATPKLLFSWLKEVTLHSWDYLVKGGSQPVYEDLLPKGMTTASLQKNYRWHRTVSLGGLEYSLADAIADCIGVGVDCVVISALSSVATPAAGVGYSALSSVWQAKEVDEQMVIENYVSKYRDAGYADDQDFAIWKRKLLSTAAESIVVLPVGYPEPEEQLLPPSNLTARITGRMGQRRLSWDYSSDDESGFVIQQKTIIFDPTTEFGVDTRPVAGRFVEIDRTGSSVRTCMVEAPLAVLVEKYRIAAISADGRLSEWSNTATPPMLRIGAPVGLEAEVSSPPVDVDLSWKDRSDNELGFRIYRWTGIGEDGPWLEDPDTPWPLCGTVDAGVETYTDTEVKPGYTHRYYVIAFENNESSLQSNVVTVFISNQRPDADFTFEVSGLTVAFADTSTDDDNSVSWLWVFGDDNTSEEQNPTQELSHTR